MLEPALASWSGGKDSMLALRAVSLALMQAQAHALGTELVAPPASWDDYEAVFTARLRAFSADTAPQRFGAGRYTYAG
ncbi:hypothetical protein GALL_278650 [mine drainage metagenome]|uniref:Phosphoadenosine phosphosulfate reductase n=1 Tax=mine drainage metagenome TaxID=410659 RepID=A0A1J5R460_9ZZZZ